MHLHKRCQHAVRLVPVDSERVSCCVSRSIMCTDKPKASACVHDCQVELETQALS